MWGTDGTRVAIAKKGMCWIFTAADNDNCEVVGSHVCKGGDCFAAPSIQVCAGLAIMQPGSAGGDGAGQ